jgi:transcriptional regulator with XRE-family HTH domain
MSVSELSRKSGVTRMTIWKLETGAKQAYTTRTLTRLAKALDKPVSELFDLENVV